MFLEKFNFKSVKYPLAIAPPLHLFIHLHFKTKDHMKDTALTKIHEALGAKMVPFAGYNMPVSYEGVTIEHRNC